MKNIITIVAALLLSTQGVYAEQRMDLEGISITGNQELPKALFIVPWQDPAAGTVPNRPFNSVLNDALEPVDPDVFRRKLEYFDAFHRTQ